MSVAVQDYEIEKKVWQLIWKWMLEDKSSFIESFCRYYHLLWGLAKSHPHDFWQLD